MARSKATARKSVQIKQSGKALRRKVPNTNKRKAKPATRALAEVRTEQTSTRMILKRATMLRIIKEIAHDITKEPTRFSKNSIDALCEASQAMLVFLFERSNIVAKFSGRITVKPSDMSLVRQLEEMAPGRCE